MKEQSLYYYMYFFFGGFHLLFSVYMIIGIPSTGSAGLINTIAAFSRKAIVVGVLGTIATVGWVVQGLGNAFYYRQVSRIRATVLAILILFVQIWTHHHDAGHSFAKAKGELAQHGKSRFSRTFERCLCVVSRCQSVLYSGLKGRGRCGVAEYICSHTCDTRLCDV
ncbi:hypothetical protein FS749_010254 [Ceratobasidium sp. UAMH 11750]|nr:hypothetical protein FS749_010254 [Ceratobasidium sp. UAMH 11750]